MPHHGRIGHLLEQDFALPDVTTTYAATNVASAAGDDTFGSWTELVADVGTGQRLIWVDIQVRSTSEFSCEVEIGEGAAASETVIATTSFYHYSGAGANTGRHYMWRAITDSARLSARVRDQGGGAINFRINVGYI